MKGLLLFSKLFGGILAVFMASGCIKPPDKKNMELIQKANVDVGMRGVSPEWKLVQANSDERGSWYGWTYGSTHRWAGNSAKTVHINTNGNIVSSEDFYYSGRLFKDMEVKNISEHLTIHFDYITGKCAIRAVTADSTLKAKIPDSILFSGGDPAEVLIIADEILSGWKTSRKE